MCYCYGSMTATSNAVIRAHHAGAGLWAGSRAVSLAGARSPLEAEMVWG